MAQPTNAFSSYQAIGNREDLSNLIYTISPTDTPFLTMAAKGKASGVYHEWQTDSLAAPDGANAHIQGNDDVGGAISPTTRLGNRTQISKKTAVVTGTQETVDKAGRSSEMAYQMDKRIKELKRDMEAILTGNQAAVVGDDTTAAKLRSLEAWYSTNVSRGSGGANGSSTQAATDATTGDLRAFTEDLLKDVLQKCYNSGGDPDVIMVGSSNKQKLSGFAGNASRTIDAKGKKLVSSVDVYVSDFGELKIVPNRFSRGRTVHVLQSDMVGVDYLRDFTTYDLAKTGDSIKKSILAEYTLKVNNEAAHGVIADLTV